MNRLCCGMMALTALALAGCNTLNRQPRFAEVAVEPEEAAPGETIVFRARMSDPLRVVKKIEGTVADYPNLRFTLRNDGQPPDKKAFDKTWVFAVPVPLDAPEGRYAVELHAYRSDGQPVRVLGEDRASMLLTAEAVAVVRVPSNTPPGE